MHGRKPIGVIRPQYQTRCEAVRQPKQYEMTGAAILNAVQFSTLQVFARKDEIITQADLLDGIRKEYLKEEKSV